jgi:hypothetical protein
VEDDREDAMGTIFGVVGVSMLLLAVVIASRQMNERDSRARHEELVKIARQKWADETDLDALALFYDFVVKQMYRLKYQDKPFDYLIRDANLILEIRDSIIENEIIREIDDVEDGVPSLVKIPESPQKERGQHSMELFTSGTDLRSDRHRQRKSTAPLTNDI